MEIHGELFGARIEDGKPKQMTTAEITLMMEDDEFWFDLEHPFAAYWIDDLIAVLRTAKGIAEQVQGEEEIIIEADTSETLDPSQMPFLDIDHSKPTID